MKSNKYILFFNVLCLLMMLSQRLHAKKYNFDKYSFLKDCKVVMLGEPTHGEGNVFEYKIEILKYLHDSLGFNTIAFESGFYDVYAAQKYIKSNVSANSKTFLNNSLFSIWTESLQFQPFFEYFEKNKTKLHIFGFDNQLTGFYSRYEMMDSIYGKIDERNPNASIQIDKKTIELCIKSFAETFSFPHEVKFEDFQKHMILLRKLYAAVSIDSNYWYYLNAIDNLWAIGVDYYKNIDTDLDETTFKAKDSNFRDSMMAVNLIAYLKQNPNEKVVCWGAGIHFMNNPAFNTDQEELNEYKPMGMIVKADIGENNVFNLTFTSSIGYYGIVGAPVNTVPKPTQPSLEASLSKMESDSLIILKNFKNPFVSTCLEYKPVKARWERLFDAIVYLPKFEASIAVGVENFNKKITDTANTDFEKYIMITVVNATTNLPIPYASAYLPTRQQEFIADDSGKFYFPNSYYGDLVIISTIGYNKRNIELKSNKMLTVKLLPKNSNIDEVVIYGTVLKPEAVIKQVMAHWNANYETKPFAQKGYNILTINNEDSLLRCIEIVGDYYAFYKNNALSSKNFDCKEVRKIAESGNFFNFIGRNIGSEPFNGRAVEPDETFNQNPLGNYKFTVDSIYEDSKLGNIIVLGYEQQKMNRWLTDTWIISKNVGQLWVREQDYAIIKVKSSVNRDTSTLNSWARKYGSKNKGTFSETWVIMTSERMESVKNYYYNSTHKKYFVKDFTEVWTRSGYNFKNSNVHFSTVSLNRFFDLNEIIPNLDVKENQQGTNKKDWREQIYRSDFWTDFKILD